MAAIRSASTSWKPLPKHWAGISTSYEKGGEHKRLTFDGYDGNIVTWLVPYIKPGDTAELHDRDYQYKDGSYYVKAVETTFSAAGGARTVELGYRLK